MFSTPFILKTYPFPSDFLKLNRSPEELHTTTILYNSEKNLPLVWIIYLSSYTNTNIWQYHLILIPRTTISSIPWKLFNSTRYKLGGKLESW